jgi:hypothetical protein
LACHAVPDILHVLAVAVSLQLLRGALVGLQVLALQGLKGAFELELC